jgi:hypothetical protein
VATQIHYDHTQLEALWDLAGGAPQFADTAAAIAQAESGGCLYAKAGPTDDRPQKVCTYRKTSKENSYGLWQINRFAHPTYSAGTLYSALGNAKAAVAISGDGQNFGPWSTYTDGAYKQYLQNPGSLTPPPGTTSTPPGGPRLPQAHRGFADLRNSANKHLPTQLERSHRTGLVTLRIIGRRSRVGR